MGQGNDPSLLQELVVEQLDAGDLQLALGGELLAQPGWSRRQRERGPGVMVEVRFHGEQHVIAARVVPVLRCVPITPIRPVSALSAARAHASAAWESGLTNTTMGRVPWARYRECARHQPHRKAS